MRGNILRIVLALIVASSLFGCASDRLPKEPPQRAAARFAAAIIKESIAEHETRPYDSSATAGVARTRIADYVPPAGAVEWVVNDDLHVPDGALFSSMAPAKQDPFAYVVPILQDGVPVSEFTMYADDGRWTLGEWLAEAKPAGFSYGIHQANVRLKQKLGPGVRTRVALLLPSGLVFLVGNNGRQEAAVALSFVNGGPGLKGFDKPLPAVGTMYDPGELRNLLTP